MIFRLLHAVSLPAEPRVWVTVQHTCQSGRTCVIQCFPAGLEQQALLGIHSTRFRPRQSPEASIKAFSIVHKAAEALVEPQLVPAHIHVPPE